MPLSALVVYMTAKFKREVMFDNYLFDALRAMLILKPGEYYPKFPVWRELQDKLPQTRSSKRHVSFERIIDSILQKL